MKQIKYEIIDNIKISNELYLLTFLADENVFSNPGQFLQVLCRNEDDTDPYLRRPFSIFSNKDNTLQIVYKIVGKGTKYLKNCSKKEYLSIIGPLGQGFTLPKDKKNNSLIISGGCGIAGVNYLIDTLEKNDFSYKLLYGVKNKSCLPDFINNYKSKVNVIYDSQGFVSDLLKNEDITNYQNIYMCGPTVMMKTILDLLEKYSGNIELSLEERMGCGYGICYTCPVKKRNQSGYFRVCKDGPVFNSKKIVLK